jgi:Protein of unknown function (DUF1573)/Secretion system C-terminal sorting domain
MQQPYNPKPAPSTLGRRWLPLAALLTLLFNPFLGWGQTVVLWNYDDSNVTADGGIAANASQVTSLVGGPNGITYPAGAGGSAAAISSTNWASGSGTKYWQVDLVTTGYNTLLLSSIQRSSNTGPRDFKVQYKVGAGAWTDVPGATVTTANDYTTGVLSSVAIPAAASNQSSVSLRWIMTSNTAVGGAAVVNTGTTRLEDVLITGTAAATNTITAPTIASGFPACVTAATGQALGAISFTSAGAGFTGSVTYTAQLSDATGSFASPVTLGSVTNSLGAGSYSITGATVPAGTVAGTAYAVRIVTTSPAVTGSSLAGQTVTFAPSNFVVAVAGTSPQTFAASSSGSLLTASVGSFTPSGVSTGVTYQWKYGTSMGGPYTNSIGGATSSTYTPQGSDFASGATGTYYLVAEATSTASCATVVRTSSEVPITTTTPVPAATVKQGATTYPSGGTAYVFSSSVAQGASSSAVTFTIQNTGSAPLNLSAFSTSGDFSASAPVSSSVAAGGSTTFTVTFTPTATGTRTGSITIPSNDPATPYVLNLSGTGLPSAVSDVVFNAGFSYNSTGIDYAAKQGATITAANNAINEVVYSVTVRDGGSTTDADALPTILDAITFSSVQGTAAIRSAALFTSSNALISNSPTINVGSNTIAFTGLVASLGANVSRVTAADGGSFNVFLRVTFQNTAALITDNTQLLFSVTSANTVAAASGSSTFGSFATVTSSSATNDNRINVIATKLVFSPAPPSTAGVSSDFTVGVVAQDANNIQDTDFRGGSVPSVTLGRSTGTGTFSAVSGLTKLLTGGVANWTDVQYNVVETGVGLITTNTGGLTNTSATMAFVAFAGSLWDNGAGTGNWNDAANWSPDGVPTASTDVWLSHSSVSSAYTVTLNTAGAVCRSLRVGDSGNTITLLLSGSPSSNLLTVGSTSGFDLSITDGGVINNNTTPSGGTIRAISFANSADTWQMTGNGTYQHRQTTGAMPNILLGNSDFAATSNFEVYTLLSNFVLGTTGGILTRIRTYGNLLLSPSSTSTGRFSTALANGDKVIVKGNLTMVNTGSMMVNRNNSSATAGIVLRIYGNLSLSSGSNLFAGEDNSTAGTGDSVVIRGNVSGSGQLAGATGSGTPSGVVQIGGNLTGVFYNANFNNDQLVFNGGTAAVSDFSPLASSFFRKVTILKEVRLLQNLPVTNASNLLTVGSTGTLDFNGFNVTGTAGFSLVAGGTLKITSPDGISASSVVVGNVRTSAATRNFPNGATYWYTGTTAQITGDGVPTTNGTKNIICDNPTSLTLTDPLVSSGTGVQIRIQSPGRLEVKQGIVIETATAEIVGTGNLTMTGGAYRMVKGVPSGTPTALPQLSGTYTLTGGAVELAGPQDQSLKGGLAYNKLRFKNAGTKTLTSPITNLPDSLVIGGAAILDLSKSSTGVVGTVNLSGPGGLVMTGTSRLKTTRTTSDGPAPGVAGKYSLTGGTIEFANSSATHQTIRGNEVSDLSRTYYNIEVTGTNVGASAGNFAVGSGGTMTVKTGGSFVMTDQTISGAGAFVTEAGSTFGYGSTLGINTSGATGNIQTGTRTFSSGGSYLLRGTLDMVTGTALPTTVENLTANLTATKVATLTNATTVSTALTLTQGHLALTTEDLTLAPAATLTGGSATSYVQTSASPTATGELVRTVPNTATPVLFPVGTSTYTPAQVTQTATATTDAFKVRVFDGVLLGGTTGTAIATDMVNRTWMLDESTVGGSDATLTVQWNSTEEQASFDRTMCRVAHFTGGAYDQASPSLPLGPATGSNPYQRSRSGLTSFSPFAVGDGQSPLPVELSRFNAAITPQRTVAVTWTTASEKDAAYFEVLRSANGREFTAIGTQAAHGNTSTAHDYRFEDRKPLPGQSFYRLRQVDLDGTAVLSDVVSVRFGTPVTAGFTAFPQPFAESLTLRIDATVAGEAAVKIYDLNGRTVLTYTAAVAAGSTDVALATQPLASGTYVVQVTMPSGEVLRTRVVK